jgi:hypothetical protein
LVRRRDLIHIANTPNAQSTAALADRPMNEKNPKPSTTQPRKTDHRLRICKPALKSLRNFRVGSANEKAESDIRRPWNILFVELFTAGEIRSRKMSRQRTGKFDYDNLKFKDQRAKV